MDFPPDLQPKMVELHKAIENVSTVMKDVLEKPAQETRDPLKPLEKAKFDLVCAYVLNAMFWIYLNTKGENPQTHGIKQELERVQNYMTKVRQLIDKPKAPKLDVGSAKRFVRHSLWTPKDKDQSSTEQDASTSKVVEITEESNKNANEKRTQVGNKSPRASRKRHRKK